MKERIVYLDLVKCTAIWLVLWGHAITVLMPQNLSQNETYVAIYSFHMPLFMMVSGLFAEKSLGMNLQRLIKKKFLQLILPTLAFFGISWWVVGALRYNDGSIGIDVAALCDAKAFAKHEITNYWFLKSLFICFVLGWGCWKCGRWRWLAAIGVTCMFLLLQVLDVTCYKMGYMFPFFIFGVWIKNRLSRICKYSSLIFGISFICFLAGLPCYGLEYSFQAKLFSELSIHSFAGYAYYLYMGMAGSMMVIFACCQLDKVAHGSMLSVCSKIGTATLGIYLWQKLLLELLLPLIVTVDMQMAVYNYVVTPLVALLFLGMCYGLSLIKLKNE